MYTYIAKQPLSVNTKDGRKTFKAGDSVTKLNHPRLKACYKSGAIIFDPPTITVKSKESKVVKNSKNTTKTSKKSTKSEKSVKAEKSSEDNRGSKDKGNDS